MNASENGKPPVMNQTRRVRGNLRPNTVIPLTP